MNCCKYIKNIPHERKISIVISVPIISNFYRNYYIIDNMSKYFFDESYEQRKENCYYDRGCRDERTTLVVPCQFEDGFEIFESILHQKVTFLDSKSQNDI